MAAFHGISYDSIDALFDAAVAEWLADATETDLADSDAEIASDMLSGWSFDGIDFDASDVEDAVARYRRTLNRRS